MMMNATNQLGPNAIKPGMPQVTDAAPSLEVLVGVELVHEYDQRLNEITQVMRDQLERRRILREDPTSDHGQQIAEINATSEITMIQVQSLVEQRKNALMMLSNLVSNNGDAMKGIVNNLS